MLWVSYLTSTHSFRFHLVSMGVLCRLWGTYLYDFVIGLNWKMVPRAGDYESVFGGLPGQVDHLPLFPKGQLARHNLLEVRYYIFVDSFIIDIAGNNAIFTFPFVGYSCPQQSCSESCQLASRWRRHHGKGLNTSPSTFIKFTVLWYYNQVDWDILTEGYSHHTPKPRTIQVIQNQIFDFDFESRLPTHFFRPLS